MAYRVLEDFNDRVLGVKMEKGGFYPHDSVDAKWLDALVTGNNRAERPMIRYEDDESARRERLLAQLREMGYKPHPNTGIEKLQTMYDDAIAEQDAKGNQGRYR